MLGGKNKNALRNESRKLVHTRIAERASTSNTPSSGKRESNYEPRRLKLKSRDSFISQNEEDESSVDSRSEEDDKILDQNDPSVEPRYNLRSKKKIDKPSLEQVEPSIEPRYNLRSKKKKIENLSSKSKSF